MLTTINMIAKENTVKNCMRGADPGGLYMIDLYNSTRFYIRFLNR